MLSKQAIRLRSNICNPTTLPSAWSMINLDPRRRGIAGESQWENPGPRCMGHVMKRPYNSGRLQGRFPALLVAGPLFEAFSQHNPPLKFFLSPRGANNEPLPLNRRNTRAIITLIVGGLFNFRYRCCHQDGWDAFVENVQDIERNGLDLHDALRGSPSVQPNREWQRTSVLLSWLMVLSLFRSTTRTCFLFSQRAQENSKGVHLYARRPRLHIPTAQTLYTSLTRRLPFQDNKSELNVRIVESRRYSTQLHKRVLSIQLHGG